MENITIKAGVSETIRMASIHDFSKDNDKTGGNGSTSNNNAGNPQGIASALMSNGSQGNTSTDGNYPELLINYNDMAAEGLFAEAFFRDQQITQTVAVLSTKKKPNALITGEAGVGKTQIVEEIARRLVAKDPVVYGLLKGATIYELPLGKIVAGSSFVGQLEEKIYEVVSFVKDPKNKAILFIDEIHQIMGSSESNPTYNKIAQILKTEMDRGQIHTIGATTTQEARTILSDPAFSRRWISVQVPELEPDETAAIVLNVRNSYQKHHEVLLPDHLVDQLVAIGDEYKQYGSHRPDTALTLLDKAMSDARVKRLRLIEDAKADPTLQHIITAQPRPLLTEKQLKQSALALITGDDKLFQQNAATLVDVLDEKIIGQTDAKDAVVNAVKRLGLGLTKRKRPVSFLFAGPSGTGKTEIAKQISEAVFGSTNRMIYINMSEFSNHASLTRLIGSSAGYIGSDSKRELPFDTLENNPYQVVLLDEFEKADTTVQRFFMQALDEGVVKTNQNKVIDFSRTIMIATTNAGVIEMGQRSVGFASNTVAAPKRSTSDIIQILRQSFDTELLNRFEHLIPFTSIEMDQYVQILGVKYNSLIKDAQANRKDIVLSPDYISKEDALTNDKLRELAESSYTPESNGRPAERTIRTFIEDQLLDNPNVTQFNLL